jgi:hypothetical protein
MKIEIQKKYKTRCGFKVQINQIITSVTTDYPVLGRYFDTDYKEWIDERWRLNGVCDEEVVDSDLDLVERL